METILFLLQKTLGAQWLSGSGLDLRMKGR